jgi:hypothetical protein
MIDHVAIGREYADNLLGEPAISRCLHAMADEIAILRSKLSLRENLEQGLMAGVARLQAEVERLRNGALEASETVSQDGDYPDADNATIHDGPPGPIAQPNPAGRDRDHVAGTGDKLTDAEREAVRVAAAAFQRERRRQIGSGKEVGDD